VSPLYVICPEITKNTTLTACTAPDEKIYNDWNAALNGSISLFASTHSDVTLFLFSSHDLFTNILDDPAEYGFDQDTTKAGGCFWFDHLHPTSQVHDVLATEVARFLADQPTFIPGDN
jgi:phospholipase/lecithinase/hemolysin